MDALDRCRLELERALGPSTVLTDPDLCEPFGRDESEAEAVTPAAVVRARSVDDLRVTLAVCEAREVPVVPRGAGTGRTGGAATLRPGVVIDTLGMKRVVELDRANQLAVVEPGVVTGALQSLVEAEGLFYPPDPNSAEWCCVGGNVAENAAGPRAFKYGVTRDWVLGLDAVVMGGELLRVGRRTTKGVAGYDLTALMVGSEGTLAVFSSVTLRLTARPTEERLLRACFATAVDAGRAVALVVARGLRARCVEVLDHICCDVVRAAGVDVPEGAGAMLLIEVDGEHPAAVDALTDRVGEACVEVGALDVQKGGDRVEREALWAARRVMSRSLRARAREKLSEDVVVPRSEVPALLDRVAEISAREGVLMPTYGHAGDGNLHVNLLWDDDAERPAVDRAIAALMRATLDLGGTITGEHGVGVMKAEFLPWEQSAAVIAAQRAVKAVFDPKGLMNPGKVFVGGGCGATR